jgi:hypothetical protein
MKLTSKLVCRHQGADFAPTGELKSVVHMILPIQKLLRQTWI